MRKVIIGPSTGWLYANNIFCLAEQETFLRKAGANGLEICLNLFSPNDKRILSLLGRGRFSMEFFIYRSLHFPNDTFALSTEEHIILAKRLIKQIP